MNYGLEPLENIEPCKIEEFWAAAHPLHLLDPALLRERLFTPPAESDLALAARDDAGRLVGLAIGISRLLKNPELGGLRWLGVRPEWVRKGVPEALAEEMCRRLKARGAQGVRIHATPPYYLRPGIDTREVELITALLRAGWCHEATHFNLTCDLRSWEAPAGELILGTDAQGYVVRRGELRDREALAELNRRLFSEGWALESALAFNHDPISLFIAEKNQELIGFAAYEVSQCNGAFGPTGVDPAHRQARLGRRLLWACLLDLKRKGRPICEIGWVGPVPFYHDACGATIGPAYWCLRRDF